MLADTRHAWRGRGRAHQCICWEELVGNWFRTSEYQVLGLNTTEGPPGASRPKASIRFYVLVLRDCCCVLAAVSAEKPDQVGEERGPSCGPSAGSERINKDLGDASSWTEPPLHPKPSG